MRQENFGVVSGDNGLAIWEADGNGLEGGYGITVRTVDAKEMAGAACVGDAGSNGVGGKGRGGDYGSNR